MNPINGTSHSTVEEPTATPTMRLNPPPLPFPQTQRPPLPPNLSLQWLEQQQQQQRNNALKQALLVAAVAQQQTHQQALLPPHSEPLQNLLRSTISSSSSSSLLPTSIAATSDFSNTVFKSPQDLEMEVYRQIQDRRQSLQHPENLSVDARKALLDEILIRYLINSTNENSEKINHLGPSTAAANGGNSGSGISSISNLTASELERLLEAESALQRNRVQDAIRMLQLQGVSPNNDTNIPSVNSHNSRIGNNTYNNNHSDRNTFATTSSLLLTNSPITPHNIVQNDITCTNSSALSQMLQPGILNIGQVGSNKDHRGKLSMELDRSNTTTQSTKRKSDATTTIHSTAPSSTKETKKPKKIKKSNDTRSDQLFTFPLPSLKKARRQSITSLKSFQDVWDELEVTPLQHDIFIRRLYKYDGKLVD